MQTRYERIQDGIERIRRDYDPEHDVAYPKVSVTEDRLLDLIELQQRQIDELVEMISRMNVQVNHLRKITHW